MSAVRLRQPSKAKAAALRPYVPDDVSLAMLPGKRMSLTFKSFLLAGAVPPYSRFLLDVLRYYNIQLAHLAPYSIVILSVFAHLCTEWLRVLPSLDLFRSYYICQPTPGTNVLGSAYLRLRESKSTTPFIHIEWRNGAKRWADEWVYVGDGSVNETAVPTARAVIRPSWNARVSRTPELVNLMDRVVKLQRTGITGAVVMLDAIKRQVLPLREDMKTSPGGAGSLVDDKIRLWMATLFGKHTAKQVMEQERASGEDGEADDGGDEEEDVGGDDEDDVPAFAGAQGDGEDVGGDDEDDVPAFAGVQGDGEDDVPESAGLQGVHADDVVVTAAAANLVLPDSQEPAPAVGGKRPRSTTTVTAEVPPESPPIVSTPSPAIGTKRTDPPPVFNVGGTAHHPGEPVDPTLLDELTALIYSNDGLTKVLEHDFIKWSEPMRMELENTRRDIESSRQEAQRLREQHEKERAAVEKEKEVRRREFEKIRGEKRKIRWVWS